MAYASRAATSETWTAPVTAIVAPPPTANGDLHVGHLSGPYLGADVLRRYLISTGHRVVSACSADVNQTYVVTTAEHLGRDPADLAAASYQAISGTFAAAGMGFDVIGMPNPDYTAYVSAWFRQLHGAGVFERRDQPVALDTRRGRTLFEAYASGRCPVCLAATKANICEACGHPNDAGDLFGLHPTGSASGDLVEWGSRAVWVIDLERYRNDLLAHFAGLTTPLRPAASRLIEALFARPLPVFPITFASNWGIPSPLPMGHGEVLNVWAEMVPGHYWWLRAAALAQGIDPASLINTETRYVQYLGFDNSFFYLVAHLALALAGRRAGIEAMLPVAFITNEFLLLENYKFSTSQGHLIWGRDLLSRFPADDVRFYLAWTNPETQQANFSQSDFETVIEREFRTPVSALIRLLAATNPHIVADPESIAIARILSDRFRTAHELATQSLRLVAATISTGLRVALEHGEDPVKRQGLMVIVRALAAGASPLVPDTAQQLWTLAGGTGPYPVTCHDKLVSQGSGG